MAAGIQPSTGSHYPANFDPEKWKMPPKREILHWLLWGPRDNSKIETLKSQDGLSSVTFDSRPSQLWNVKVTNGKKVYTLDVPNTIFKRTPPTNEYFSRE